MAWYSESARRILVRHATPRPQRGTSPRATFFCQHYGVVNSRFGTAKMGGDVVEVDWGIHPESESGTCFRTNHGTVGPRA